LGLIFVLHVLKAMQSVFKMPKATWYFHLWFGDKDHFMYQWFICHVCTDPLKYNHPQFAMFNDLVCNVCDVLHMVWYLEP
jgi:hypothetical protein